MCEEEEYIETLKSALEFCPGLVNGPHYSVLQRQLGEVYYRKKDYLEAIYHFTESHAVSLRQTGTLEMIRSDSGSTDYYDNNPLSFYSSFSKEGAKGMLKRLQQLPSEWTLVQLTRSFEPTEVISIRKENTSPKLKDFYLTRLPCGSDLKTSVPVTVRLSWPEDCPDIIQSFIEIKKKLGEKKGTSAHIRKTRQSASLDLEKHCREIGPICLKEWTCLMLGKLYSKAFEDEIREMVDNRLIECNVTKRERYLCYLLAESSCHLENSELEVALYQIFEGNEVISLRVLEVLVRIKESYGGRLHVTKRHPVLLILDDHLDNISWESMPVLRRHPVSRVYSLHIAHYLYLAHKDFIQDGVREIDENEICFYIVNPDGNLPTVEEHIPKFLKKRFPNWIGIIGKKPSEQELIKALTESNSYIYCGHGSGSQYLSAEKIQRLKVKPLQFLYGCGSVALKDLGGLTDMHGDVMEFALAKSGCTLGMLWPVTTNDTDRITMVLANVCFSGTSIDINTFEPVETEVKKEGELLRALREVRECVEYFFNGAALVARGIPIKLVNNLQ